MAIYLFLSFLAELRPRNGKWCLICVQLLFYMNPFNLFYKVSRFKGHELLAVMSIMVPSICKIGIVLVFLWTLWCFSLLFHTIFVRLPCCNPFVWSKRVIYSLRWELFCHQLMIGTSALDMMSYHVDYFVFGLFLLLVWGQSWINVGIHHGLLPGCYVSFVNWLMDLQHIWGHKQGKSFPILCLLDSGSQCNNLCCKYG